MGNNTGICIGERIIQRIEKYAGIAIICAFIIILCILFVTMGIVWSLADFIIRKCISGQKRSY